MLYYIIRRGRIFTSAQFTEGIQGFEQISGAAGKLADKLTANNLLGSQIKEKKKRSPKCQLQIILPLISKHVKAGYAKGNSK